MNRCPTLLRLCAPLMVLLGLLALAQAAHAQVRQFPQGIKAGTLTMLTPPEARLDGAAVRLAPGVRIMGQNNMQVMSAALAGQSFVVAYLRDPYGLLSRVWVLNEAEVKAVRENLAPTVNFNFGSTTPAVKVDDGKTPYDQLPKYPTRP